MRFCFIIMCLISIRGNPVKCCILSTEHNFQTLTEASEVIVEANVVSQSTFRQRDGGFAATFKIAKTIKGRDLKKSYDIFYLRINLEIVISKKKKGKIHPRLSWGRTCPVKTAVKPGNKYFLFLRTEESELRGFVPLGSPIKKSKRLYKLLKNILCVSNGPIIKKVSSNSSGKINEGQLLRLKCRISCGLKSETTVQWYKNGQLLRSSQRIKIKLKSRGRNVHSSTLIIQQVTKNDRGVYECRASTRKRVTKISVRIRILEKKRLLKYFDSKNFLRGSSCPISSFCLNGGKCVYYRGLGELTCICASGFKGKRCEHKDIYDKAVSFNKKMGLSVVCVLGVTHYPC